MKIKDLDPKSNLGGIKVKTSEGIVGYWKSQWAYPDGKAGVWLSDGESNKIYPQCLDNLTECLEWDIVDDTIKIKL